VSDRRYRYTSQSGYAGASGHYEQTIRNSRHAGVPSPGVIVITPTAGWYHWATCIRRALQACRSEWQGGAIRHYEHAVWNDRSAKAGMARTAEYTTSLPPELMLRATVSVVGPKAMHPLIKPQQYDGTESLDTFLKMQCMTSYLFWMHRPRTVMSR